MYDLTCQLQANDTGPLKSDHGGHASIRGHYEASQNARATTDRRVCVRVVSHVSVYCTPFITCAQVPSTACERVHRFHEV